MKRQTIAWLAVTVTTAIFAFIQGWAFADQKAEEEQDAADTLLKPEEGVLVVQPSRVICGAGSPWPGVICNRTPHPARELHKATVGLGPSNYWVWGPR